MKHKKLVLVLILIFFVFLLYQSNASSTIKISGYVLNWLNASNVTDANVTIKFYSPENDLLQTKITTTNSSGGFSSIITENLKSGKEYKVNIKVENENKSGWLIQTFEV